MGDHNTVLISFLHSASQKYGIRKYVALENR